MFLKNYKIRLISVIYLLITFHLGIINAGTIKGKVIDNSTHDVIGGAKVSISNHNNSVRTNSVGEYVFKNLEPGNYVINAKIDDYENSVPQELIIKSVTDTIHYDIYLKPKTIAIDEVKVIGNLNKETNLSARTDERIASNVMNIISARTIESLPDQNVADVMVRISGVSMTKNGFGSNSNLIIRGMPTRYNNALVDGIAIPSTSKSDRSVNLEMFGSELVGRIEVYKALTPDFEGDAIGGTVNIKMKQAPDTAFLKAEIGSGYNQYYFNNKFLSFDNSVVSKKDFSELNGPDFLADASLFPRQNLVVKKKQALPNLDLYLSAGRRFFNKKLGLMFAGSVQNTSLANTYTLTYYSSNGLDPKDPNNLIPSSWEAQEYSKIQKRYGGYAKIDYQFNKNNQISLYSSYFQLNELRVRQYTDRSNDNGAVNYRPIETETQTDNSGTSCTTLGGEHKLLNNLDVDWTLLYAAGNTHSPDYARIEEAKLGQNSPIILNYSQPVIRNWQWNIDENKSAYLNINYKPILFGHLFAFKAGGMTRNKFRKNYVNEYHFDGPAKSLDYPNPDLLNVPLTNNQNAQQKKGNAFLNPGNYRAWEDISAVYCMVTTNIGKLQLLTGIRTEFTYTRTAHNQNNLLIPVSGDTANYYDILPSLHLTYKFNEKQNLRFSVYKSINRPGFTETIPYNDPRAGAGSGTPGLQHTRGNCYDLRYEIYPKPEEVLSAGIFYKRLINPIENLITPGSENTKVQNASECTNFGLELVAAKYIGNFGFSANYTFTHSEITVPKNYNYLNTTDGFVYTGIKYQIRPLVGQSPHLINLSISYQIPRWGFRTNFVYTMQGYNMINPSSEYKKDTYQENYHNLGLTIDQKIGKRFIIIAKASNLLNSPIVRSVRNDGLITEKSNNYQSYYIGLKFNL